MASTRPTEPPLQHLEPLAHCVIKDSSDVYAITQLSIDDSYDSPPTTSNRVTFSCQINTNSNGNQLFPLGGITTNNYIRTKSWHHLLNYLKTQQIVKNIEIFKNVKPQQKMPYDIQKFPLKEKQLNKFPLNIDLKSDSNYAMPHMKRSKMTLRKIFHPGKIAVFLGNIKVLETNKRNHLKVRHFKQYQKMFKYKRLTRAKRNFRTRSHIIKIWKKLSCRRTFHFKANNQNHLLNRMHPSSTNQESCKQFPLKFFKTEAKFPLVNKNQNETNKILLNVTQSFEIKQAAKNIKNQENDLIPITKFPYLMLAFDGNTNFPIINKNFLNEHSSESDLYNYLKESHLKNAKTNNSRPSISMLQSVQNMKYFDNEHVFQVQDAQVEVMESPQLFTMSENSKQTPPRSLAVKQKHYGNNDDEGNRQDIHKLADSNSINNSHSNEVGYYAEKIEYLQDAIISLFEKIQNSLITNHKSDHGRSTNATKADDHGCEGNTRFALTPPMSVTSVRNSESINAGSKEVPYEEKFDLGDLCISQHVVECSDVRDTLTEAVDCGNTKEQIKSTGSILVKSEESATLCTPKPPPTPPPETDNTSFEYKSSKRELLLPNNINLEKNFNLDTVKKIDSQIIIENELNDTVCNTFESNFFPQDSTNEMTVTRLNKSDEEKTSNCLKANKATESKNHILTNNKDCNEMKFEMHKIKSALPSSVSERAPSKPDNLKPTTNNTTNSTLLPLIASSPRNYTDSSYTSRSQMKSDSQNLAVGRRTSLNPTQLPDNTKIRPVDFSDSASRRTGLNLIKSAGISSTEPTPQRRPSLASLRNIQSTSQLSVDLPDYTSLAKAKQPDKTIFKNRATSVDTSLSDILPERTRLRRQRRLKAQNSQEEPEDAIERLNRLRARISASLSEVKGVLKQYNTEAENENDNENQISSSLNTVPETNEDDTKEGPVMFRFVKKVRRRSIFTDDDEKKQQEITKPAFQAETQFDTTDETDHCRQESAETLLPKNVAGKEVQTDKSKDKQNETKQDNQLELLAKNIYPLKEEAHETVESKDQTNHYILKSDVHLLVESSEFGKEQLEKKPDQEQKDNKTLNTSLQTLKAETQELGENQVKQTTEEDEQHSGNELENKKKQALGGAIPKLTISPEQSKLENINTETRKKLKKKIIIKPKDTIRRASLAAVEGSKIVPPVQLAVTNKIQRRPSDSEELVKKKMLTAKLNTSGTIEEVTPKPKIVKVKKSSPKSNSNSNNSTHLATMQTKLQEEDFALITTNVQSNDDHNKLVNKDNQSIVSDKNQDVLVPELLDLEKQQQQQQLKNEISRQANSSLPTQSVIDEAASLNEKTIKNSVLTPTQQQQHHYQNQQEENQKATIKSTATKLMTNGLQAKGAMLENVTTVTSSATASEANSQKTRESIVQPTDYHDLLQTEIALGKSSTSTARSINNSQLSNKVETAQPKVNISGNEAHANLDKYQTETKELQQKQAATQNQQVLKTTDVAIIKNDDNNSGKHEDLKAPATLKEPCKESATTSTHVEVVRQQQQRGDEQSATTNDTKTISSPHNSISCTSDIAHQTTTKSALSSTEFGEEKKAELSATEQNKMPELQLAPAPVQTADIIQQPEHHKKKIIIKKIIRQTSVDKTKQTEIKESKSLPETQTQTNEADSNRKQLLPESQQNNLKEATVLTQQTAEDETQLNQEDVPEECPVSTEISESSISLGSEDAPLAMDNAKKERIVKKKVIIKRQKRRLSIGENFFHAGSDEQTQNAEIETLEKPIAFVSDDEAEHSDEKDQAAQADQELEEEKKPLKSCILRKEYNIGDEVLYAERFKKTQIKWRRGRIKERITSISYLLDIDGKDVSSHINYLKKFTGRKVSFGGKEYLEIDYEQLAEEEEKAERLKKRSYSIWNMV